MIEPQPAPDGFERKSFWTKVKDTLLGAEETGEEEIELSPGTTSTPTNTSARKQTSLRIQSARALNVAIRTNAQVFEDAKVAADGFKNGEQQIVNLERATPQMAERIIDFLNGVCYALDGTVERVGEKVYLFAPANVSVEVDEGATANAATTPTRRVGFGDKRDS